MKYILNIISWITLATLMGIIILLGYWSFRPYKILDIKSTYKVLTPTVKSGETLKFQRNVDKLVDIQGDVNCSIVDGIEYKLPERKSITMKGIDSSIQMLVIPNQIVTGIYKYVCHITFQVNPIRTIVYYLETEKFKVIND